MSTQHPAPSLRWSEIREGDELTPFDLPLTDRASGLLFPPFNFSQVGGFTTVVPLFLTLGRSADATVGAGIFTGAGGQTTAALGSRSIMGAVIRTARRDDVGVVEVEVRGVNRFGPHVTGTAVLTLPAD